MFQRMIDDFKDSTGTTLKLTSLVAAAALALFIMSSFLCAAAFVYVLQRYGLIEACLAGAGVFFIVAMVPAIAYLMRKKQIEARAARAAREAEAAAKSMAHSVLADPMLVAAGIQVIRAIGIKKLIPILAVGGLALGFLASRNSAASAEAHEAPAE